MKTLEPVSLSSYLLDKVFRCPIQKYQRVRHSSKPILRALSYLIIQIYIYSRRYVSCSKKGYLLEARQLPKVNNDALAWSMHWISGSVVINAPMPSCWSLPHPLSPAPDLFSVNFVIAKRTLRHTLNQIAFSCEPLLFSSKFLSKFILRNKGYYHCQE